MKLPADIRMQLEALPVRAVMFVYRQLFGWAWDRIWRTPLPDPRESRPYTIAWEPPLDYEDAMRFHVWLATGKRRWVFVRQEGL